MAWQWSRPRWNVLTHHYQALTHRDTTRHLDHIGLTELISCVRQMMADQDTPKIACVVGATGNQGGSVARRFAQAGFHVRGLTRNTDSSAAKKLISEGIELVTANLEDVSSLKMAFQGANVIFSVTNYWEPFFRPDCRRKAEELKISCRKYAYDVEYQQGKNIADAAAATVDSLDVNGFLVSTLSHAEKCSQGAYKELYHFDSKADVFPLYVNERHPDLAAKMSCIHTGFFYSSFNILPNSYLARVSGQSQSLKSSCWTNLKRLAATRWQRPNGLHHSPRPASPPLRPSRRHGQLHIRRLSDASRQSIHGGGHNLQLD